VKHADIDIPPDAHARLERFASLLLHWNVRINLISRADEKLLWPRHILDCAQLAPLLPATPGTLIDLGSGAGFPGLVLAALTKWRVHLVESDQRKATFLREATRELGLEVRVHAARAEAIQIEPANVVTARALAPLADLLSLSVPLLKPGGICLFPKGRGASAELTAASAQWHMHTERFPSRTDAGATLLRISEISLAG